VKIENLRSGKEGNRARVAATMTWEDCDRPTHEVYFETDEPFAEDLSCNPHAFLVGCVIPAMHYGEERAFIDAEICPELRDGLITAMSLLRHWYYDPGRPLVRIEAGTRSDLPTPRTPERAGFFFSGGIDSFATLRTNRLGFPLEHPGSIKDGLLVYGLELDDPESFRPVLDSLSRVAQEFGITLIPVYTNIYLNYRQEDAENHFDFWTDEFEAAAFAAIAHAFSRRLSVITLASSFDIPNLRPHGSHALLDPNYSSSDLRIRHDGIALSRFAKTKLVAEWGMVLQHLRVCNRYKRYQPGRLNCGECEKCVRTMLMLVALGALDQTCSFPTDDVSEELVRTAVRIRDSSYVHYYQELIVPLAERGRHDLVRAVERKIAEYHRRQRLTDRNAMIGRLDRQYLGGSLARLRGLVSRRKIASAAAVPNTPTSRRRYSP
jgi:hypothetical protein